MKGEEAACRAKVERSCKLDGPSVQKGSSLGQAVWGNRDLDGSMSIHRSFKIHFGPTSGPTDDVAAPWPLGTPFPGCRYEHHDQSCLYDLLFIDLPICCHIPHPPYLSNDYLHLTSRVLSIARELLLTSWIMAEKESIHAFAAPLPRVRSTTSQTPAPEP